MYEIPTILTSQELLDKSFSRARKVRVKDPDYRFRKQKINMAKMNSASAVIDQTLQKYVKAFPSFDNISPFYVALIDLMFPINDIRRALGRIDGARKAVTRISSKTCKQIQRTGKPDYMEKKLNEGYGRVSSLVKDLDEDLSFLADVREGLKRLPGIPTSYPTAVIAGYPSVGKSQLIEKISTARPKIATYPFTTQQLNYGFFERHRNRYQLVDTPGLLDRPFDERNRVEKQAILALNLLSNVCVFMVDPTGHCGYDLEPQLLLLESISESIPDMNIIVAVNKSDLIKDREEYHSLDEYLDNLGERLIAEVMISALTGEGLEELEDLLVESLRVELPAPWDGENGRKI